MTLSSPSRSELGEPLIDLFPDLRRHHGFERRAWNFEREIAPAAVADVDDLARGGIRAAGPAADQETRDGLDRFLGRRKPHAKQSIAAQRGQPLERDGQVRPAFVRRQGMNLVDDHGPRGRQHGAPGLRTEQDVERFRRGDHDVRRPAAHALAFARRRIAGPHPGADIDIRQALLPQGGADARQRRLQVALDIVRQRLERRDIDDLRLVAQLALDALPHQGIDRRHEGGERLAGPGRRGDQDMAALANGRPGLRLRGSGRSECPIKPCRNGGMKQGG